ncbi:prepilin peptidase [Lentzea sp. NPDC051838]|uniref:prepilin peptidase n=1 Tax=Lentzea sp. NPDC051838 TaxID=3154849 RepID=UPI00344523C5
MWTLTPLDGDTSIFLFCGTLGAVAGPAALILSHSIAHGKTMSCDLSARIGWRPLLSAGAFLSATLIHVAWVVPSVAVAVVAWMVILGFLLVLIDWSCHQLPHRVVAVLLAGGLVQFSVIGVAERSVGPLARAGAAAVVVFLVSFVIYLRLRADLGFGDVTLATTFAAFLGWFGWQYVLFGLIAGLVLAGIANLVLLAARRISLRDHTALGPALIVGSIYTVLHV